MKLARTEFIVANDNVLVDQLLLLFVARLYDILEFHRHVLNDVIVQSADNESVVVVFEAFDDDCRFELSFLVIGCKNRKVTRNKRIDVDFQSFIVEKLKKKFLIQDCV